MSFQALQQYVKTSKILNDARGSGGGYAIDTECKLAQLLCKTTDMSFYVQGHTRRKDANIVQILTPDSHWATPITKIDLNTLKGFAKPAPHGHGAETKVDETVRCALEISGKQVVVPDEWCRDIMPKVCRVLCPSGKTLKPHLYKLHIYEAGGFFESHVDTLHAPNHFATLIIALPTEHEGGDLTVTHNGWDNVFTSDKDHWMGLPWCAFFTDCHHSVAPVTEGTRVVLQYDLYLESQDSDVKQKPSTQCDEKDAGSEDEKESEDDDDDEDEEENKEKDEDADFEDEAETPKLSERIPSLKTSLWGMSDNDPQVHDTTWDEITRQNLLTAIQQHFDSNGYRRVGIILRHQYGRDIMSVDVLRGTDAALAQLCEPKYKCSVEPFLLWKTRGYDDESLEVNLSLLGTDGQSIAKVDDFTGIVPSSTTVFTQLLDYDPYVAYTGNESSPAEYLYFGAVLFLEPKNASDIVEPPRKKQKTKSQA